MSRTFTVAALLAGSAFTLCAPAQAAAQDSSQIEDLQAKIELLQSQVEALQEALQGVKAQQAKAVPSWKGAPESADKASGFTFKPKGLAQFDAGYVGFPDGDEQRGTVSGLNFGNLGFNSRARRLVLGAEGTLPGRFGYKVEFNFAQGNVDYEDIILTYDFETTPLQVSVGNFYPYSSLETMTSSRLGSMMERASFTDAFNYNRRLGVGIQYSGKKNDSYLFQAGIFSTPINDAGFNRTGWQASLRGIYSPRLGSTRLHVGANFQHRSNNRESMGQQYRTRPLTQITDQRFIDTTTLASAGDDTVGVELAAIHKSLHVAAEAQKVWVRDAFSSITLDPDNNDTPNGTLLNGDPSFWGGYFEVGYFLTGETRGYKGGKWDRTKVLKPWSEGGWGAFQVNGRVDYVDLSDRVDDAPTTGLAFSAPYYVNGGKQLGLQASLIWNPVDWVRFLAQVGHLEVTGGPRALGLVDPAKAPNKRSFGVDTFAARAQVEF
jgi:phosphate-selective porin OprO/OprP